MFLLFFPTQRKLNDILTLLKRIMASQDDAAKTLNEANTRLQKIGEETKSLLDKIAELQAQIDAGETVSPELQAAIDAVVAQAGTLDDLVPDLPTPEPPPEG